MTTLDRGAAVAVVLAGAWRSLPPALTMAPQTLTAIVPLLARGGAGGLAWHRLRGHLSLTAAAGRELRQHYRWQTLRAGEREATVRTLIARLRAVGIEPLLIKGWAAARLYPETGLRPSADVDLCVPARQLETAVAALSARPLPCPVDLHADVPDLPDRSWDDVFRRSCLLPLDGVMVRVPGLEDHLRLLGLHLARHGIARPLWLCDVGAALEALPAGFDWDYCTHGDRQRTAWLACVLGLATRLLGARLAAASIVPPWVERAVLWCWGVGAGQPWPYYLCRPKEAVRRLRYHGLSPNHGSAPIKAAYHLGLGPARGLPLLGVQLAAFVRRKVPHVCQRFMQPRRRPALPVTIHHH